MRSAQRLKQRLDHALSVPIWALIISDSAGRALAARHRRHCHRRAPAFLGVGPARRERTWAGRPLEVTEVGFADAVAAMAVLAMGEAAEARPAALVRGLDLVGAACPPASALVRPKRQDMFR